MRTIRLPNTCGLRKRGFAYTIVLSAIAQTARPIRGDCSIRDLIVSKQRLDGDGCDFRASVALNNRDLALVINSPNGHAAVATRRTHSVQATSNNGGGQQGYRP